jgi:uncharacterized protein (DUF362 family)
VGVFAAAKGLLRTCGDRRRTSLGDFMSKSSMNRRDFLVAGAAGLALSSAVTSSAIAARPLDGHGPIGRGQGIHPGRVVWVHDPEMMNWDGPGDGRWWEPRHTRQDRVDTMMARAVCGLTGAAAATDAWDRLFRHQNRVRGGNEGYRVGQKVLVKPNWVGMIHREPNVDLETYTLIRRRDYMNTGPQMVAALLAQLVEAGVRPADITVCDTLAYAVREYRDLIDGVVPGVRFEDFGGGFGCVKVRTSTEPFHWSCRPDSPERDFLPTSFAEAEYIVNFANLKAHRGSGVTLCAKNHYGSLVRWPVQKGYFDMHAGCFAGETGVYRPLVDLMGHEHLGGKTVLHLIDAQFSGVHPSDHDPRPMKMPPFDGDWPCSLFASQDPVAIDSVGLDFLQAEWDDVPRRDGADDYLHEAALADDPPSGTFYDPNHAVATTRLASLGVHEHWNSPREKRYSRNLGMDEGIELIAV